MKPNTKKMLVMIMFIVVIILCNSNADAEHYSNPNQNDVWKYEEMSRHNQLISESDIMRDYDVRPKFAGWGTLECTQQPVVGGKGVWRLNIPGSYQNTSVKQAVFCVSQKDWMDDYSTIFYYDRSYNSTNPFSTTLESCEFVTSGDYKVQIWVYFTDGEDGYAETVFTLSGESALKQKIASVVSSCRAATKWETALKLHDWLITHVYYDLEYLYYGADMILRGYGVCDGYSKAYYMLCQEAGIPINRIRGEVGENNDGHAWNAIQIDGQWYYVDPTWDDPAGDTAAISGDEGYYYFCLNQSLMQLDHHTFEWINTPAKNCTSLDANYYIYTEKYREWGDYSYYWEGDTPRYFVTSYLDKIAEAFGNGDPQYDLKQDSWWYMDGSEVKGVWADTLHRTLLAYALNHRSIFLPTGEAVLVRASVSDDGLSVALKGWNITESGILTLPAETILIGESVFEKTAATSVIVPNGCSTIPSRAFADSDVRTVYVPNSVTFIAEDAFDGCQKILLLSTNEYAAQFARNHGFLVGLP